MTNREKLLQEISELPDRQLMDLMMAGYCGINPHRDFGVVLCEDCQARNGGECIRQGDDEDCADIETAWMHQECRHDRLLEVGM